MDKSKLSMSSSATETRQLEAAGDINKTILAVDIRIGAQQERMVAGAFIN